MSLQWQGRFLEAEQLLRQSLAVHQLALADKDPKVTGHLHLLCFDIERRPWICMVLRTQSC
jgi:hypothetical protein